MAVLALVAGLAGCGGVEGDEGPDDGADVLAADDIGAVESELTYAFTCYCLSERSVGAAGCGPRGPRTMTMTINTRTLKAHGTNTEGPVEDGTYRYDSSYVGRGSNANYRRYTGSPHVMLAEKALTTGGYALKKGGKGGYLQYTYTGDVYENVKYICKR